MKSLFTKSNLIQLIAVVISIIFAAGVVTYSWYLQETDTEDLLQLQADGAQVIMFEAEVSEAALEGTLYPAKAKKAAYLDGTIPDVPQVIMQGGILPDYIDTPAGIVTFDTNLTYYALGLSGKIRMEILSTVGIKNDPDPTPRNLQSTGEVNASYQFELQDFYLTVEEDGVWNIMSASFPSTSTVFTRGTKKFFERSADYVPLTGDTIVYNNKDVSGEYSVVAANDFVTTTGDDVRIYDYQVSYIRGGKKYIESYANYQASASDQIIYINKIDSSCTDNKIENVLLTSDLVFYTRAGKNYIEKLSVYNSGLGATDDTALKTSDIINYISVSNAISPVKPVYLGSMASPSYVEYYVTGSFSTRYVASSSYWTSTLEGNGYTKATWLATETNGYSGNGITFDSNSVVYQRKYSGTTYTCVDHKDSYTPQTGDIILSYSKINAAKVTTSGSDNTANLVDIRNSAAVDVTDRDTIYIDGDEKVRWSLYSDFDFSTVLPENLLFANVVDTATGRVIVENYIYDDPEQPDVTYVANDCLVLNDVSFNDAYTLVKRIDDLNYYNVENAEDFQTVPTTFYHLDKDVSYLPQTLDEIYYNIYAADEILYDPISGRYTVNDLDLYDEDLVYSRSSVRYVVKTADYISDPDDILIYQNASAVGQEILIYDNTGYKANKVGLEADDTVYLRNNRIYVCNTIYYVSQLGDILLYSNGTTTTEGQDYIETADEGEMVDYYVDNVSLLVNDEVYFRDNKFRFIYKLDEAYVPDELDNMIFDSGYMIVDAQTRFLISGSIYLTTLDQETSRDLIGATISLMLSMESPDIV